MKKGVNKIQEMKEEIVSILPSVGRQELDIEEIIGRLEFGIEYLNHELIEKALNELVWEKKVWISIRIRSIFKGYVSYKNSFSLSER